MKMDLLRHCPAALGRTFGLLTPASALTLLLVLTLVLVLTWAPAGMAQEAHTVAEAVSAEEFAPAALTILSRPSSSMPRPARFWWPPTRVSAGNPPPCSR